MEQQLMAFWKYDQYPYCLWGIVDEFKTDKVYIKSYQGWVRPFLVVEKEYGEKLSKEIAQLKLDRDDEFQVVRDRYEELLDTVIKIPGINA